MNSSFIDISRLKNIIQSILQNLNKTDFYFAKLFDLRTDSMNYLRNLSQFFSSLSLKRNKTVVTTTDLLNKDIDICYTNLLPNETLIKIFESLDFKGRLRIRSVCRHWNQLIESMLETTKRLRIFHSKNQIQSFANKKLEFKIISKNNKSLRGVTSSLISSYFCLTSITLFMNTSSLMKSVLKFVTNSCDSDLRKLKVRYTDPLKLVVDHKEVEMFCQKFQNLEKIQIKASKVFVEQKTIDLMIKNWQHLKTLIIRHLSTNKWGKYRMSAYSGNGFRDISPELTEIVLTAQVLDAIAIDYLRTKPIHGIRKLTITCLKDYRILESVYKCSPFMLKICLSFDKKVVFGSDMITMWPTLGLFKYLRIFHISMPDNSPTVSRQCIDQMKNCRYLQKLCIKSAKIGKQTTEAIAQHFPNLTHFMLRDIEFIDSCDDSIAFIAELKNLYRLYLGFLPDITNQILIDIINNCPDLRGVDLPKQKHLSGTLIAVIIYRLQSNPNE